MKHRLFCVLGSALIFAIMEVSSMSVMAGPSQLKRGFKNINQIDTGKVSQDNTVNLLTFYNGFSGALQAVVLYNPAVKGKLAELESQRFKIDVARAERYPSFSMQANNLDEERDIGTIRLQQPLWAFGKIDTAVKVAKAGVAVEQKALLQVQRDLIEDTAAGYANIQGIRQRMSVATKNITEHNLLYQRIKRRQEGKLASLADVRLAYSRLVQAKAQQQRYIGEELVALSDLRSLTQVDVACDEVIDIALSELPNRKETEVLVLSQSAEVSIKRERLKVVRLEVKQAKVASLPTLYARVEKDVMDSSGEVDRMRSGLVIEGNFDGMGFSAARRVKGASAQLTAAREDLSVTINDTKRRVAALMQNREIKKFLVVSQKEAVAAVEETMSSFLRQYEVGRKSWLEVLNTQRELTELKIRLAQMENDWLVLSLRVAALSGRLDQLAGINAL